MTDIKNHKKFYRVVAYLFLLLAMIFVLGYLWSGYFLGEYDMDVAEMVAWADSVLESGKLGNPDFYYSYFIPFGGHLFLIPFIKLFGPGLFAHRCGMTVYSFCFIMLMYLFFNCLFASHSKSAFFTGIMIFCLCSVKRMRLLFWTHSIFYSLSVLFLLGAFVLLYYYKRSSNKKVVSILIFFLFVLGSAENRVLLVLFFLPFIMAFITEIILSKKLQGLFEKEALEFILLAIAGTIIGLLLYQFLSRGLTTVYGEPFHYFSIEENFYPNIHMTLKCWFSLFAKLPEKEVSMYTIDGCFFALRMVFCLFISSVPFLSIRQFAKYSVIERVFCLTHFYLSFFLFFLYIFETVFVYAIWRLAPVYFTSIVLSIVVCFRELPEKMMELSFIQIVSLIMYTAFSVCCGISLVMKPRDRSAYYGENSIITKLYDNDLTYGYSLNLEYANTITVLTNGEIKSRGVMYDQSSGRFEPFIYNTNKNSFEYNPEIDTYFLIISNEYLSSYPQIRQDAIKQISAKGVTLLHIDETNRSETIDFTILVFDHDILDR